MNRFLRSTVVFSAAAIIASTSLFTSVWADEAPPTTAPSAHLTIDAQQQAVVDKITTTYLSVQKQLANDSFDGVVEQFNAIGQAADRLSGASNADLTRSAQAVATAAHAQPKSLDAARDSFKPLSEAVAALTRIAPPTDAAAPALYEVYCPMAKASWLQTSKDVSNPFLGQSMATCGKVRSTLKGAAK